jgi:hypothetical protein
MTKSAKDIAAGLLKKGFVARESDHTFYQLSVDGRKTVINTKISHGEKEIGDPLLGIMARQLRLSKRSFLELVDCPLSLLEYIRLLRENGHIA